MATPKTTSYNGYCMKCQTKRDFDGDIHDVNQRRMAKGTCPVCGSKINRILGNKAATA